MCALSVLRGTMQIVPKTATPKRETAETPPLVSHTGVPLTRPVTFRFTLDPTREQHQQLLAHAGASRLAFNQQLGRVKANLEQRAAERSYGIAEVGLTPSVSWSKVSLINYMNAWKDGRSADARVSVDPDTGEVVRGLAWRGEVSTDVFETASVNAAQALKNWSDSRKGARPGRRRGSRSTSPGTRRRRCSGSGRSRSPGRHHRYGRPGRA